MAGKRNHPERLLPFYYGLGRRIAEKVGVTPEYVSRVRHDRIGDTPKARQVRAALQEEIERMIAARKETARRFGRE